MQEIRKFLSSTRQIFRRKNIRRSLIKISVIFETLPELTLWNVYFSKKKKKKYWKHLAGLRWLDCIFQKHTNPTLNV